ncbi:hypothetical protein ACGFLT_27340 [Micromonospora chalcea]
MPVTPVAPAARREFREAYERLRRYFIVVLLHRDFLAGRLPDIARVRAREAAEQAGRARAAGLGFCGTIVASQLLIVVGELLQASGMTKVEADRMSGVCEHQADSHPGPNDR